MIQQRFLPKGARRGGDPIDKIQYIVAHDTGNSGSTAAMNVDYYMKTYNDIQASAHFFVDDTVIINDIPVSEKAWHVRYNAGIAPNVDPHLMNDCAISVELCYGASWGFGRNMASYVNYVSLIASLCVKNGLDPFNSVLSHCQLDPSRRTDPLNAFGYIGKTWQTFLADIVNAMNAINMVANVPVKPPRFAHTLRTGANGPDVVSLQQFLATLKFFTYGKNTGYYGTVTTQAVAAFQKANGLPVTSQFDEVTRQKANSMA